VADVAEADVVDTDFEDRVEEVVRRTLVNEEARRRIRGESAEQFVLPEVQTLKAFLAVSPEDVQYRIVDLMAEGSHIVLAAQYKSGKTTLVGNVVRCLADGGLFLGQFKTERVKRVAILDNELDPRTLSSWLRDQGIKSTNRVSIVSMRGRVASFNILDDAIRAKWAEALRGIDVLVFDCLRPVLDALGLDENTQAGRFLTAFDALLYEAGISEAVIVHHMGHSGERSRGDSRILDWPDATWKLIRQSSDDPTSPRFFSAFGRDVDVPESLLSYDPASRHLTLGEGNRNDIRAVDLVEDILDYVAVNTGSSLTQIRDAIAGDNKDIASAIKLAVDSNALKADRRKGRGGGMSYSIPE
jgi:hypothetical protein